MTPSSIKSTFLSVLAGIENNISKYVQKPGSDMTRHRSCPFEDTVTATLCLGMNRTETELQNFFAPQNQHIPTKSAFIQQRKKLNSDFFPDLLDSFNHAIPLNKTYKGFHLIASDGSDINLPTCKNDTVYRIQQARSDNYYYQMHLNALFDICENRYVSALIQPRPEMNETEALCTMIDNLQMPGKTIFIADRGYVSLNTLAHLTDKGMFFLIRAKSPASSGSFLKHLLSENTETDKNIRLAVTRSRKQVHNKDCDGYKFIKKDRIFSPIQPGDTVSVYYMDIRCTCVKLDDDSYEYLVSNLPMEVFSSKELKSLYWKRWSIETSFRRLKYAIALSYLHSVNRELIKQEIYAKMILYNLSSLLQCYAQHTKEFQKRREKSKYSKNVSFDNAVNVVRMLFVLKITNKTIKALLLRNLTAVKEGQSSPRKMRSQTVNPLNNRA